MTTIAQPVADSNVIRVEFRRAPREPQQAAQPARELSPSSELPPALQEQTQRVLRRGARLHAAPNELRTHALYGLVGVRQGRLFDPLTGQGLLEFAPAEPVAPLGVVLPLVARTSASDKQRAYTMFLEGCRLDLDEATRDRAAMAYRSALDLDPTLAAAANNLAMLHLAQGQVAKARGLFERSMFMDAEQVEAPYNLACLALEEGAHQAAIRLFLRALEIDPMFANAHYNLAVALESTGQGRDALAHWCAYLALEPEGSFAATAKEKVRGRL